MSENKIKIKGARTNNLKNIDIEILKNKLTVITGLSGSGKSSLAFDTLYAEGQRRYVESLSAYARQFLGLMDKPDVDSIEGLSPAISIDQKSTGHNPRSTVGTVTEIYDYLRLLYARVGHPRSPFSGDQLSKQTIQEITDKILGMPEAEKTDSLKVIILAPLVKNRKGTYEELLSRLQAQGFVRVRVNGEIFSLDEDINLDRYKKHNIEVVIDRLVLTKETKDNESALKRVVDSLELAVNNGEGELYVHLVDKNEDIFFSEHLVDPKTGKSFPEIEPHSFSFNSPHGACSECNGLGFIKEVDPTVVYNPRLTIKEGGIYPLHRVLEKTDSYKMKSLEAMANKEGFDLETNIGDISEDHLQMILYGSGSKKYKFTYTNYMGVEKTLTRSYDGIIPWLEKKHSETESDWVRNDIEQYMVQKDCPLCKGYRLSTESLAVTVGGKSIADVTRMSIATAYDWIKSIKESSPTELNIPFDLVYKELFNIDPIDPKDDMPTNQELEIGKQIFAEIESRLQFLLAVGLEYLTINRRARTLSGGESQRIRLASQIGTGLSGVLYVLDEPSIGLHQRDNDRLIETLKKLRDVGNTVVVVEHDEDTMREADDIIDIGPGAGEHGGEVMIQGTFEEIISASENGSSNSITADFLSGKRQILKDAIYDEIKSLDSLGETKNIDKEKGEIVITNVSENNLKGFDFFLPLGKFVCVTGVSGSGKSTLVNEIFYKALARDLNGSKKKPGKYGRMQGIEWINKLVRIDQSPIGKTPRSNPATYTGVFDEIRKIFSETKESRQRGYKPGRFSFNVKGGRCEKCQGAGLIQISMQFLPDVYVTCDECNGKRYNRETLQIDYKGKNIAQILDMTIEEGLDFFSKIPKIASKLQTLMDVGLGYIRLGQGATTLSGGESQRVKLSTELSKRQTGDTLYILDEPTTGLHFEDVRKLLVVLHGLVARGNSVLVIEHNLDVIKTADWIVDLGPEGGDGGGSIVAIGTPEEVANTKGSYTGDWLKKIL